MLVRLTVLQIREIGERLGENIGAHREFFFKAQRVHENLLLEEGADHKQARAGLFSELDLVDEAGDRTRSDDDRRV